jgi:ribosomal protein S27E
MSRCPCRWPSGSMRFVIALRKPGKMPARDRSRPGLKTICRKPPSRIAEPCYVLIPLDAGYRRDQGENPQAEEYRARFPDLESQWLDGLLKNSGAGKSSASDLTTSPEQAPPTQSRRVRCPQCHNPIQLSDNGSEEILCPGCGSSFRIREASQTSTTGPMRQLGKFQSGIRKADQRPRNKPDGENKHARKILETVIKMRETAELNERIAGLETHLAMPTGLKRAAVSTVLRSRSENMHPQPLH